MNAKHNYLRENVNAELTENETITQLAHRHLKDKSHTTTDAELRNAKIELSNVVRENKTNLYRIKSFTINNFM
ncbi:MAG: hypothetical protein WKG06_00310 [Segetibacter sp.]